MNVSELLKKATRLKKEKKLEEAIQVLEEAYSNGVYESPSEFSNDSQCDDFDKLITLKDLVRKAKYLQELGKFNDSISYLDSLIEKISLKANYSFWEIDELSELHNHKAIIFKKEKKYLFEFIERMKSYCLNGISATLKSKSKDDFLNERFKKIQMHYLDNKVIRNFIEKNSKKTSIVFDYEEFINIIQKIITLKYKVDQINFEINKFLK